MHFFRGSEGGPCGNAVSTLALAMLQSFVGIGVLKSRGESRLRTPDPLGSDRVCANFVWWLEDEVTVGPLPSLGEDLGTGQERGPGRRRRL